jgi:hypothetical protein
MSWHISLTRFASAHIVKKQDAVNSCGIACILMVNFKIKKGLMFAGLSAGNAVSAVPIPGASYVGHTLSQAADPDGREDGAAGLQDLRRRGGLGL